METAPGRRWSVVFGTKQERLLVGGKRVMEKDRVMEREGESNAWGEAKERRW